ncbi:hypothetical protein GCM10009122_17010 [Fulvivirga kasyanovii]|uniref:YtxH domain-containing protein n=1 Tax=Fulvivirga kasyanovii TaxID=396812 RepID=A0ABW9RRN6_9BACT|nr:MULTISPECIES: hypothetical protein [Fulvivirga]MTI26586.1 hypothetical protein [Fulvivirga kasyanovii]UII33970.1 hypothetical protein LVD17_09095 [Fulvivirga ulvae]
MKPEILSLVASLSGVLIGGGISLLLQRNQLRHAFKLKIEELKTEHMAERTARYYLSHKSYTDRRFDTIKKGLGGFEDDELRKILVRAGAIRSYRDDEEWWTLLERMPEKIEKLRADD